MKHIMILLLILIAVPLFGQEAATDPPVIDPNLVMALAGIGAYLATVIIKKVFPLIPSVLIPWIITPLLGLLGGYITTLLGGDLFWQVALGTLLSSFANGLVTNTSKAMKESAEGKPLAKVGDAAKSAPFWAILIIGSSLLSGLAQSTANAQVQGSNEEGGTVETYWELEPSLLTSFLKVQEKVGEDGTLQGSIFASAGIGAMYSSLDATDPEDIVSDFGVGGHLMFGGTFDDFLVTVALPTFSLFDGFIMLSPTYDLGRVGDRSRFGFIFGTNFEGIVGEVF